MTTKDTRRRVTIRCSGQAVNPRTNQPYGPVCGQLFTSAGAYRTPHDWIERARAAGWRISPLRPDHTVNACCPTCCG